MSVTLNSEELFHPVQITPALGAGVRVGEYWISIEYADRPGDDSRTRYRWRIFSTDVEYTADDLQSGCGGDDLTHGLCSLLSFLGACAESVQYGRRTGEPGENADLFPTEVAEIAYQYSDEISMLQCEIEEQE
jgi:hypothetical protein